MSSVHLFSAHRRGGWEGQYHRMVRWVDRFKKIDFWGTQEEAIHEYFDTMYACFQNIFFLKDWLKQDSTVTNEDLNDFINNNKEIGICRDVCNGTKHYDITNASVDKQFGIIRSYNPYHESLGTSKWSIVICADGEIYKPHDLMIKCISLWNKFLSMKLNVAERTN